MGTFNSTPKRFCLTIYMRKRYSNIKFHSIVLHYDASTWFSLAQHVTILDFLHFSEFRNIKHITRTHNLSRIIEAGCI